MSPLYEINLQLYSSITNLSIHRLGVHQKFIKEKLGSKLEKPTYLVMHGGSGSSQDEIRLAVKNGVIKMNIDTDTQWAYWQGNCVSLTQWR